jgi:hypothetical protein
VPAKSIRKRSFTKGSGPSGGGALLGYARVSKGDEQDNALQTKALKAAGCRRLFEETASGGRWDRPELHRLLDPGGRHGCRLSRPPVALAQDVLHIMERSPMRARVSAPSPRTSTPLPRPGG